MVAETEVLTPESPEDHAEDIPEGDQIRPHEKRALNFLVNEYLLMQEYKLTSVTFAEENEDQVKYMSRTIDKQVSRYWLFWCVSNSSRSLGL